MDHIEMQKALLEYVKLWSSEDRLFLIEELLSKASTDVLQDLCERQEIDTK